MRKKGFWIFERTILDHKLWQSPNTGRVWLYLMNVATHKPQPSEFEGRSISLGPGQSIVKRAEIGKKLRLSPGTISRSLASLAATGAPMTIAFKSDGVKCLLTMPYWDFSQSKGQAQKAPCAPPCASDSEKLRLCCASPLTNNKSNKGEGGATRSKWAGQRRGAARRIAARDQDRSRMEPGPDRSALPVDEEARRPQLRLQSAPSLAAGSFAVGRAAGRYGVSSAAVGTFTVSAIGFSWTLTSRGISFFNEMWTSIMKSPFEHAGGGWWL
jgi:hypothetical protein